jgi:glucose-6-phosphate 1-epimerase
METVELEHASGCRAVLHLNGAHLTSWVAADGREMLFVSERARFEEGVTIRGGVPVIFPQFGEGALPKHGFARTAQWEMAEMGTGEDGAALAIVELCDSDETRAIWPYAFRAELTVSLADSLSMTLAVTNTGEQPFAFTGALHTYFRVDDIRHAAVEGLNGVTYIDKTRDRQRFRETRDQLRVGAETDRVYVDAPAELRIRGAAGGRTVTLRREGFRDAVVWNPWAEGARALPDFAPDEYLRMLCVEAAAAAEPVPVAPGETWRGTQIISVG